MPLRCGICPVSSPFGEHRRWCHAFDTDFPADAECAFSATEHMIVTRDWYANLVRRITEAIAMREAEERAVQ